MRKILTFLWHDFWDSINLEHIKYYSKRSYTAMIWALMVTIALALYLIPQLRALSGFAHPKLIIGWITVAASISILQSVLWSYNPKIAAGLQLCDSPLYASILLFMTTNTQPPFQMGFGLWYAITLLTYAQILSFSFLATLVFTFVPAAILALLRPENSPYLLHFSGTFVFIFFAWHTRTYEKEMRQLKDERKAQAQKQREMELLLHRKERLASLGTLAAGLAHEINNPLSIIQGYSERFAYVHTPLEEVRRLMPRMQDAIWRIAHITKMISSFTEPSRKNQAGVFDPIQATDELISTLSPSFHTERITIKAELSKVSMLVKGSKVEFQQAILQLLNNAKEAISTQDSGAIHITVQTNERITLKITDNGIGISNSNLEKVFDPFFTTKAPGKGMGIGLWITHSVISEMGGILKIASNSGQGTTVEIQLPQWSPGSQPTDYRLT